MADRTVTCTPMEEAVLQVLRDGPAGLGARTEVAQLRRLRPRSYAGGIPLPATAGHLGPGEVVRTVDQTTARRLARKGWVLIDAGGTCRINPELEP